MKNSRILFALAAMTALACGSAAPAPVAAVATTNPVESDFDYTLSEILPPKFFSTKTGLEIEMVYLREGADGEGRALCRLRGLPHPLAGKAVFLRGKLDNNHYNWRIRFNGKDLNFIWTHRQPALQGDQGQVRLKLPRSVGDRHLEYSALRSKEIDTAELIASHKTLVEDGSIAQLEGLDRDYHIQKYSRTMERSRKNIEKKCGTRIPIEVDWESVFLARRQSTNGCGNTFDAVAKLCTRDLASRRQVNRSVKKIVCGFGDKESLATSDEGVLRFQLASGAHNYQSLYPNLMKLLKVTRTVLQAEDGRYLVVDPERTGRGMYLGDGKTMNRLVYVGYSNVIWSTSSGQTILDPTPKGFRFRCSEDHVVFFNEVSDDRRMEILANASFEEPVWQREAYGLARDDRGIYYYVDHLQEEFGGKDYKVYIGPRGQMRATTLLDVVDDSKGTIFATKTGKLRLIITVPQPGSREVAKSSWIAGKKTKQLIVLPIRKNKDLIYKELGVYDAESFGTPCER